MNHLGTAIYMPTYKQKIKHDADFSKEQSSFSENFGNLRTRRKVFLLFYL